MNATKKSKGLNTLALVLLVTSAIDSIRNLPASALFGTNLIFFYLFGAAVFLIPISLVIAELSASWSDKGGIYQWVSLAFGKKIAFLAIWLQWVNTMVWYPSILSFIAGTFAYLINPQLAANKIFLVSIILTTFWTLTVLNLKGIRTSAKFASYCVILGMFIPLAFIILLSFYWVITGKPVQIHFTSHDLFPTFTSSENWISLTAIVTSYLGIELAAVHVKEVDNPQKTFPKALFTSVFIIVTTMLLGSMAIALVIPSHQINLVDGVMQAFYNFFKVYHLTWMLPILASLIFVGSLGEMTNWMISPAKGLLQAANDNFLPIFLQKENKHGVASRLLLLQAILVSITCLVFLLMPSVNGSYWLLTDLSTELYVLMYLMLFVAFIAIQFKHPIRKKIFNIPGGFAGSLIVSWVGIFGCLIALIIGFFPPTNIEVGGFWHYEISFSCGLMLMILPIMGFYIYQRKRTQILNISEYNDYIFER